MSTENENSTNGNTYPTKSILPDVERDLNAL